MPTVSRKLLIGAIVPLLLFFSPGIAAAQSGKTADASAAARVKQPPSQMSPGMQSFSIRRDTLEERESFLRKRESSLAARPPRKVPPLPQQRVTPHPSLQGHEQTGSP